MHRSFAVTLLSVVSWLMVAAPLFAATLVQEFYLPMPEPQLYTAENTIQPGSGSAQNSIYSIVVTGNGTQIYYDQWEDGYEIDLNHPAQASTQIWGDGNDANGIPPGFAHDPAGLNAGTVITLTNQVPLPRNPSVLLYDGRDRVSGTKALVITHAGWPVAQGPVFGGAASVLSTIDYGTNYICPVGNDITNKLFQYCGLFVMAAQDNTSITIDPDGAGAVAATNIVLNRGESFLYNNGIKKGATVTATKGIQAHMIIGHISGSYAADWFTLSPVESWSDTYFTPVPSASSGSQPAYVYLFNANSTNVAINYQTLSGSGSFTVAAKGVSQFQMPKGSGASFTGAGGAKFYALCTVAANNAADTAYNWGFALLPKAALTTEADVGWAPGSSDGTVNGSPVWVTPLAATRIYVDYKGDHSGPLTDPNGNKYDTNFDLVALQSKKIYDPTKDQTGMRVYTLDGTLISAAWGEDPDVAAPGNPYIDAGTVVLPFPVPTLLKTSTIVTNAGPPGLSIDDVIQYTVQLDNKGLLPLGNTVVFDNSSTNLVYVPNTTTLNGVAIPDDTTGTAFPLDAPGYTIPIILSGGTSKFQYMMKVTAAGQVTNSVNVGGTTLSSQTTITPGTNTCNVDFSDSLGATLTSYPSGSNIFVTISDPGANTSPSTQQTITIVAKNNTSGDYESITLTETGANTGVFRNSTGLPTSLSTGVNQQDGVLHVAAGDALEVDYTNPLFGNSCTALASIQVPTKTKVLYLSDPNQALDRIDPVAAADNTTSQTVDIGSVGGGGGVLPVGLDRVSNGTVANNATLTISHTTAQGTNRYMLVGVSFDNNGASVSSVKYGPATLAFITNQVNVNGPTKPRLEIWGVINPPTVTTNLVITFSTSVDAVAGVTTLTNVDQNTPLSAVVATTSGGTSAATVATTISSAIGSLVFDTVCFDGGATLTAGAGQTARWNAASTIVGGGSTAAGAPSVTMSWTNSSSARYIQAAVAVQAFGTAGGGTNYALFNQTPAFSQNFSLVSGGTISITNYVTVTGGSMPASPNISATLQYAGIPFLTLSNPVYSAGPGTLVWTGTLSSNVTIVAGQAITYALSNFQSSVTYRVNYDSATSPSKITLPTTSVIHVDSVSVYDAPYPGGNVVSAPVAGSTLYVRVTASDPFGSYDISSVDLSIDGPGTSGDLSNRLTFANLVSTNASSATYEYIWQTGATAGGYNVSATANEGTEGITDVAATSLSLVFLDLGTPSTSEFTSGNNGLSTNAFGANSSVCVRVADLDQNANSGAIETLSAIVTSSSGDSEAVVMTETGTNTGIFTACLTTSTNSGAGLNNGVLLAPVGSLLTLTYTDPNDSSDTSTASGTIQPPPGVPGVFASKTLIAPANGQAVVGDMVQFNLQVVNSGSTVLSSLSVTDNFPAARLAFVASTLAPDVTNASALVWTNLGTFNPGQATNILVSFTATASGTASNNLAAASGPTTGNSFAVVSNTQPALTVTKTLLSPTNSPVSITSNVVFRIIVKNTGTTVIPTLPMEDSFSAAYLQYVSATIPPDGSGAGSLIWTNLAATPLAVGASITNDITMLVKGAGSPALNSAVVDFAIDANGKSVPTSTSTSTNLVTAAAKIAGTVYNDVDQSGTLTTNDVGLGGVTLQLFTDPNGDSDPADGTLVQIATSDASGAYEFANLPTGHFVVVETDLPGYSSSAPANNRLPLNVTSLTTTNGNNFFDYQPSPTVYASISGTIWYDSNGNGTNELGEPAITNGVNLDLVQDINTNGLADAGEPVVLSVTSDGSGNYSFQNLTPGNYVVRETDLYGYYSTGDSIAPNDNQVAVTLTNSATVTNINFLDRRSPIATNDVASAANRIAINLSPLTNDFSPNGDALVITNATSTNGTVVINSGSTNLTFTGTNVGSSTIVYTVSDAHGGTSSAIITVQVTNNPPVANNDSASTGVNTPVTISAVANDTDPNGDNLTVITVNPTNGTASVVNSTNVLFTPTNNFSGTATIGYTISDGNGGTASAVITVNVTAAADVIITKSAPTNVYAGSTFSYTISVTNAGPSAAAGLSVTDNLPAGLVFVSTSPAALTNGNLVVWTNLGSLAAATSTNLILTVTALPGFSSLTNVAVAVTTTFDSNLTNNTTPPVITAVTPLADLAVGKAGPAVQVAPGATISYAISVTNLGPSTAVSLSVTDNLPGNVSFVSASPGATLIGGSVAWTNLGNLPTGVVTNLNILVTGPLNGTVTNSASAGSTTADTNTLNNTTPPVTTIISNVPPVAVNDAASTSKNVPVTIPALANDTDANGDALTIVGLVSTNGTAVVSGTNVLYTPAANFSGTTVVIYTITDGQGGTNSALITITIGNSTPVANNDSYVLAEDTTLTVPAGGVLSNDTDADNDSMTAILGTTTSHGTLTLNSNGSFTYAPATNYNGTDSFTYRANDGTASSGLATVTLTITSVNDAPVANGQSVSTPEDTAKVITLTATDVDNDALTYSIVVGPTNGTILGFNTNTGSLIYTPNTNFNGTDHFTFVANDGTTTSASALVTITVTSVNDAPVANGQSVSTPEDAAKVITLTATDVDNDPLTYSILSGPTNGTILGFNTNTGSLTYTPNTNFYGTDHFTFVANDGTTNSAAALVTITVTSVNDAPIANGQSVSTPEDMAKVITLTATDVDNDPLTYSIVVGPTNGTILGFNTNTGSLTYTPNTNFNGSDHFTFVANDGTTNSAPALVTITVTPVNDAPVANGQSVSTPEDTAKVITLAATDVDNDPLTYSIVVGPTNGTILGLNTNTGSLAYTPNTNFNGSDHFTFLANDGTTNSVAALVTITVTPVNDAPVANNDSYGLTKNQTLAISAPGILANDTDADNDPLTAVLVATTTHGNLTLNANGGFSYTPISNYFGADSFTYRASDGIATSGVATVSLTITNVNHAPVLTADSFTNYQNTPFTLPLTNLLVNDYDPDGDTISVLFLATNSTQNAHITVTPTNFTYFPPTNFNGTDSFLYAITDGKGGTATGSVFVVVQIAPFQITASAAVFNPQTGLFEQNVGVTNTGSGTVAATRLLVTGLRTNVTLYNGIGFESGYPYVQYNSPLNPGQGVRFALEFYVPDRRPLTNGFIAEAVAPSVTGTNAEAGVPIDRSFMDLRQATPRFVIEWASIPGRTYTVLYSDDMIGWKTSTPSITANANRTQWYDDGPPKTDSLPLSVPTRFYRVLVAPTN